MGVVLIPIIYPNSLNKIFSTFSNYLELKKTLRSNTSKKINISEKSNQFGLSPVHAIKQPAQPTQILALCF